LLALLLLCEPTLTRHVGAQAPGNWPGSRAWFGFAVKSDMTGFWVHGGDGYAESVSASRVFCCVHPASCCTDSDAALNWDTLQGGTQGGMGDLWYYSVASGQWTW
jgi:hypothetical protein